MQAVVGRRSTEKEAASNNTLSQFEVAVLITQEHLGDLEQLNSQCGVSRRSA